MDLAAMRERYVRGGLDEADVDPDPFVQFGRWMADWLGTEPYDPSTVVLATVDPEGWPAARAVLLKGVDERGFVFFTNTTSDKGRDLAATPRAALCFVWQALERQVRVVGAVRAVAEAEADAYFATRPRGSQLGAWASAQSQVVPGRHVLEEAVAAHAERFPAEVPRPSHWGGYRVVPRSLELWQGRDDRLHDRLRYRREAGGWVLERLSP